MTLSYSYFSHEVTIAASYQPITFITDSRVASLEVILA